MALFDRLTEFAKQVTDKTAEIAKQVGDKTNDMLEIGKLNAQIGASNNSIEELKTQLGDHYWNKFVSGETLDDDAVVLCNTIKEYTEEIESLKAQLMTAQSELLKEKDRIISLQGELREGIEERAKYAALLEDAQDTERRLAEAQNALSADREQMEQLRRELDQAQAEASSYHRSFFGFYRKG